MVASRRQQMSVSLCCPQYTTTKRRRRRRQASTPRFALLALSFCVFVVLLRALSSFKSTVLIWFIERRRAFSQRFYTFMFDY